MKRLLARLLKVLHALEDGLLVGLLLALVFVAVMQIVLRNGFDGGFLWADAFLRVLVLWIGLAGAMAASREHRHISIDILGRFLPQRARARWRCSRRSSPPASPARWPGTRWIS